MESIVCLAKEFCPVYYRHGEKLCKHMLKLDRCPIRKADLSALKEPF